jgi:hypothetical protein
MHTNAGRKTQDKSIIKENIEDGKWMHQTPLWEKGKMHIAHSSARDENPDF